MNTPAKCLSIFYALILASAMQAMDVLASEVNQDVKIGIEDSRVQPNAPENMKKFFGYAKDSVTNVYSKAKKYTLEKITELTTVSAEAKVSEATVTKSTGETKSTSPSQASPAAQKTKTKWFNMSVRRPTQSELMKFGAGIFVIVAIGSITYILYKNGTLEVIADKAQEHPYITASIAGSAVALLATVYACYKYQVNPFSKNFFSFKKTTKVAAVA